MLLGNLTCLSSYSDFFILLLYNSFLNVLQEYESNGWEKPDIQMHKDLSDVVVIKNRGPKEMVKVRI